MTQMRALLCVSSLLFARTTTAYSQSRRENPERATMIDLLDVGYVG